MSIKSYRPVTPSLRQRKVVDASHLSKNGPEKSLLVKISNKSGRNNTGRITVRHRGGGNKRQYRVIDVKRINDDIYGVVVSIEYDPFRTSNVALVNYINGDKSYILATNGLKVGDRIVSGKNSDIKMGNCLPLENIPVGTFIHNIELVAGRGGQLVRSAGAVATILGKNNDYVSIRLPSGEIRLIHEKCRATIGQVGNLDYRNRVVGKAGASRWARKRPSVRGSVMNPCDHPHGGGEGKSPVGRARPLTPWGKPALGYKTRNKRKKSKSFILSRKKK